MAVVIEHFIFFLLKSIRFFLSRGSIVDEDKEI